MVRIGRAAEMLGVTVETLRRWERDGKISVRRTAGGQRVVASGEIVRLRSARGGKAPSRSRSSARNRFAGVVTRVERDRVAAVIEVLAGPHRLVSLLTAESVDDLDLKVGDDVVCVIKATNVIVERAAQGRRRSGTARGERGSAS